MTDILREETESDEMRYALLGWTSTAPKRNAGADYGSGYSLTKLKALIDKIEFSGFDPSFLYPENQESDPQ